jgi:hypothetical protein
MKALVFLMGGHARSAAQDRDHVRRPAEDPLGPLATTAETAAAWHRWSRQIDGSVIRHGDARRSPTEAPSRRPTSA